MASSSEIAAPGGRQQDEPRLTSQPGEVRRTEGMACSRNLARIEFLHRVLDSCQDKLRCSVTQ